MKVDGKTYAVEWSAAGGFSAHPLREVVHRNGGHCMRDEPCDWIVVAVVPGFQEARDYIRFLKKKKAESAGEPPGATSGGG